MENKKYMTLAAFISLIIGGGLSTVVMPGEIAYVCESTQEVCIGTHLSGGIGTRCYFPPNPEDKIYKKCSEGWKEYQNEEMKDEKQEPSPELKPEPWTFADGRKWTCPTKYDGYFDDYTKCHSPDGKEAYLGEKL